MAAYIPSGYLTVQDALIEALLQWHGSEIEDIFREKKLKDEETAKNLKLDTVRAAINSGLIPTYLTDFVNKSDQHRALAATRFDQRVDKFLTDSIKRFRDALYLGRISAWYIYEFSAEPGPVAVPRAVWATSALDDAIETGGYDLLRSSTDQVGRRHTVQLLVDIGGLEDFIRPQPQTFSSSTQQVPQAKRKSGRPKGSGFAEHDRRLFPAIDELIRSGRVPSARAAANLLDAEGKILGAENSRAQRLTDRYNNEREPHT